MLKLLRNNQSVGNFDVFDPLTKSLDGHRQKYNDTFDCIRAHTGYLHPTINCKMAPLETVREMNASFEECHHNINDVSCLRSELCQMQVRCEELEQDRKYNVVRANELQEIVKAYQADEVQDILMKKSMQVAEISMEVDRLHGQIRKLIEENEQIKRERDADRLKMVNLSNVVRSIQNASAESDDESEDDVEDEDEDEVLTPEKALDMTLKNMKYQIETLEDERQKLSIICKGQVKTISSLKKDNELMEVRVEMLEELLRMHHLDRTSTPLPPPEHNEPSRPQLSKTSSVPHLGPQRRMKGMERMNSVPKNIVSNRKKQEESGKTRRMEVTVAGCEATYTGPLLNGSPHGVGTLRFKNGDTYLGEMVAGEMHGKGTLYHREREQGILRGMFEHNVFTKGRAAQ